eukprot:CAMPEP_0172594658 /NCGR_PEP_ID=MMETSP1068-20121228/14115_1 /TAXON_ID=35684 /ORGANISM="Pseudopedinella elastica, Strain CCMP716" /LENGTH=131 /DNA_ID=CAMNT_0013392813 /DNA_START=82 /DNA_END=477 /DNA_ORIENTATION=-
MVAAGNGQKEATAELITAKADVHASSWDVEGAIGRTALHWAANKGKEDVVALLVKSGANANGQDASGWAPLHCALLHGHVETALALVRNFKADKAIEDNLGNTAEAYCSPEVWAGFSAALASPQKTDAKKK